MAGLSAGVAALALIVTACSSPPGATELPPGLAASAKAMVSQSPSTAPSVNVASASASHFSAEGTLTAPWGATESVAPTTIVTMSDDVRVRSEPQIGDTSIKYDPPLRRGTPLHVLEGPVSESGYVWYKVSPVSNVGFPAPGYGWIAVAGKGGESWIAAGPAECPPMPADIEALTSLALVARLGCFSGRPISVQARLVACDCDVDGGGYTPSWFGGGTEPLVLAEPSETHPPAEYSDWLIVRLDPAGRFPAVLPVGEVVEVTGVFDHPAALDCRYEEVPVETAGSPAPTSACRFMFVTTTLVVVRP